MIKFEVDPARDLFIIRYHGAVTADETEKGLEQIVTNLVQLPTGFRVLADLSDLQSMEMGCAPFVEKAMGLCNKKGASLVVRVIPDPQRDIGLQIMSIFHYGSDVRIVTCETLAAAEAVLDE